MERGFFGSIEFVSLMNFGELEGAGVYKVYIYIRKMSLRVVLYISVVFRVSSNRQFVVQNISQCTYIYK